MKKLLIITLSAIAVQAAAQGKFVINGALPDDSYNGKMLYLGEFTDKTYTPLDSCLATKNSFRFEGIAPQQPTPAVVRIKEPAANLTPMSIVVLEKGEIKLSVSKNSRTSGTPENDKLQSLYDRLNSTSEPETGKKAILYNYLKENMSNKVGEFMFVYVIEAAALFEPKQVVELIRLARPEFQQKLEIQSLMKYLSTVQPSVGDNYVDVKLKNLDGKEASISDYTGKHKYVLIDFWASWCGPCIRENPTLLEAYGKYHARGFEIIGLSLDDNHSRWTQTVKRLGITWPQLSDLGGWNSLAARTYKVNSIPASFLINAEGVIIAKNLRGEDLLAKLAELLGT
ncbi:MAG: AhpC/TSA family protein [Prevotella sp.]|nr:AhpC/TSA family protein [Prevotella sp.]